MMACAKVVHEWRSRFGAAPSQGGCVRRHLIRLGGDRAAVVVLGVMLVVALLLTPGCGALPRNPIPEEKSGLATVPGMPGVRFWGDAADPQMMEAFVAALDRERASLGLGSLRELPQAQFLGLSGGGSDGAFGAGLLCGWTVHGTRPQFEVVTGVSTGALIAPFAFLGPDYDDLLREVYTSVSLSDIARIRGLIRGLVSDALADNDPLRALVEQFVDDKVLEAVAEESRRGRLLIIGTTDMDAERPVIWSMGAIARSGHPDALALFRKVLLASAAIPGVFPPAMIEVEVEVDGTLHRYDEMHADGGVTTQVFLYPSSFRFDGLPSEVSSRGGSVYVIRNGRIGPSFQSIERRTLPIARRAIGTLIKTQGIGDLIRIYLACLRDGFEYRLASIPNAYVDLNAEPFDPEHMRALFDLGFEMAKGGFPWRTAPPGFGEPAVLPPEATPGTDGGGLINPGRGR